MAETEFEMVATRAAVHGTASVSPSSEEVRASCFAAIAREFNPIGFGETMLALSLSRLAAEIIRDEQLLDVFDGQVEKSVAAFITPAAVGDLPPNGLLQARLCVNDRRDVFWSRNLRNIDAFVRLLHQLQERQRLRADSGVKPHDRDPRFATEAQCLAYLLRRFRLGQQVCRCCRQAQCGSWIAARRCWHCSKCGAQTCSRWGTVFARSHVPLNQWFHAIAVVLQVPRVTTGELAKAIGIRRQPTVRTMLSKIRAAMLADDASNLLAGLDSAFLPTA